MTAAWRIRLLGTLDVEHNGSVIARFRAQRYGILLAYLALRPQQMHSRDELIEMLWPDTDRETGRTRLRQALASLRRQLEPPGTVSGSVIVTHGHAGVQLNPANVHTDVSAFEAFLRRAVALSGKPEQADFLQAAIDVYNGPLLPGFWSEWTLTERERLGAAHVDALRRLAAFRETAGDLVAALDLARRACLADPNTVPAHADVMRLLAATHHADEALRQFDTITRIAEHTGDTVPAEARKLAEMLRQRQQIPPRPHRHRARAATTPPAGAPHGVPSSDRSRVPRLPVPLTPLFGREEDTAQLLTLLRSQGGRLVTLTGLGGSGKTRLALHVAHQWEKEHDRESAAPFPACVFVPLVDVRDAHALPTAIADALRLDHQPGRAPLEQIVDVLSRRPPLLLVLDNFEHLLAEADAASTPATDCLVTLLQSVASLTCLVTSRQRLLMESEQEFPVPPLPVPSLSDETTPEALLRVPSIALFVNRAQNVRPDFQITSRNARSVVELCTRLEGIPLAIEIAAAWAGTVSVAALLTRLDATGRFSLLTSRRRDVPPRHRTLRAAIETSIVALPPDLRLFFARLCVFHGGWTADAAARVCDVPLTWAEDALAHLSEYALITLMEAPHSRAVLEEVPLRFRLLETLRELGAEYLQELGGTKAMADLRARHADFFLTLAEEAEPHLDGPAPAPWLDRLEADLANLTAALTWARDDAPASSPIGLRLAGALRRFWGPRGSWADARHWLETFLNRASNLGNLPEDDAAHAKALLAAADFPASEAELTRTRELAEAALEIYRGLGDTYHTARALRRIACLLAEEEQHVNAIPFAEESQVLSARIGDAAGTAEGLVLLAQIAWRAGDADALLRMEQALEQWRRLGYTDRVGEALNHLGCWTLWEGFPERAEVLLEEALELCRRLNNRHGIYHALWALGNTTLVRGELTRAAALLLEGIAINDARGVLGMNTRNDLARVRLDQNDLSSARDILLENLALTPNDLRAVSFVFDYLARIAVMEQPGHPARPHLAVRLWGVACGHHETRMRGLVAAGALAPDRVPHLEELPWIDDARATLGAAVFQEALEAGKRLDLTQAARLGRDA